MPALERAQSVASPVRRDDATRWLALRPHHHDPTNLALLLLATLSLTVVAQEDTWGALLAEGFQHLNAGRVPQASAIFDQVAVAARAAVDDTDATEARIRAAMGSQSVIHLATHAVASSRRPAESLLAFRAGDGHDGRLTAGEINGMSLRADLVVLSACHGASDQVAGEGMLGLSRALLAAGTHSLLASVRELHDEAAAEILPRFYAAWRNTGDGAGARRSAQLEQLRRLRSGRVHTATPFGLVTLSEHPSLWAGFVLIGGLAPLTGDARCKGADGRCGDSPGESPDTPVSGTPGHRA